MKTMEKLALLKKRRNACLKSAEVHHTIEIYAGAILESLETLARFHGLNRADLLELLVATAWALEQIKAQED